MVFDARFLTEGDLLQPLSWAWRHGLSCTGYWISQIEILNRWLKWTHAHFLRGIWLYQRRKNGRFSFIHALDIWRQGLHPLLDVKKGLTWKPHSSYLRQKLNYLPVIPGNTNCSDCRYSLLGASSISICSFLLGERWWREDDVMLYTPITMVTMVYHKCIAWDPVQAQLISSLGSCPSTAHQLPSGSRILHSYQTLALDQDLGSSWGSMEEQRIKAIPVWSNDICRFYNAFNNGEDSIFVLSLKDSSTRDDSSSLSIFNSSWKWLAASSNFLQHFVDRHLDVQLTSVAGPMCPTLENFWPLCLSDSGIHHGGFHSRLAIDHRKHATKAKDKVKQKFYGHVHRHILKFSLHEPYIQRVNEGAT